MNEEGRMNLRQLFSINMIIAIFFGLSCTLIPRQLFQLYGLTLDESGVWATRLVGGSILGYATLMLFGRKTNSRESRRAIAIALLVQDTIGLLASLEIQFSGFMGLVGWSNPALYLILTVGYAYFIFIKPSEI
jgi:hypothetical protein